MASSRAANYTALIPAAADQNELDKTTQFIIKLSKWESALDQQLLEKARKDILRANGGKPPKVLDPFAGGGSIPLEALRLGCETYASDYNPVATLMLKCTLEYPQKYSGKNRRPKRGLTTQTTSDPLLEEVEKWGNRVFESARAEIGKFYPNEHDGSVPVGYFWARTIPCQNPSCNAALPLIRQFWLAKRGNKKVALYPYIQDNRIRFKIVGTGYEKIPSGFDPNGGTVSKAVAVCLVCGSTVDDKTVRKLFTKGKSWETLLAVALFKDGVSGKKYRVGDKTDLEVVQMAEKYLEKKRSSVIGAGGLDPVPDEAIHTPDNREYQPGHLLYNFTPVVLYGKTRWSDLFTSRQKLTLVTFVTEVREAHKEMIKQGYDEEFARVISSYLGILISRFANRLSSLAYWYVPGEKIQPTFVRQALAMVWDFFEMNPFNDSSGGWGSNLFDGLNVIQRLAILRENPLPVRVTQGSATSLPYPDEFFDAILTDPPYYDNVPYADLSDFFYVWLKRAIGDLYPDLFSTPLSPKSNEAIAELPLLRGMGKEEASKSVKGIKTSAHFERMLRESFKEMHRVLKPEGICVIVYAHKSTAGWETLINSLLDSGIVVTGAWPIHTEMRGRLRANASAALASSIYMIGRKEQREPTGFYKEVRQELRSYLNQKLDSVWSQGISGADFLVSAIGSSIEVFGKYEKIIDDEGNQLRADRLLEDVRKIVIDYAVKQVLHNGFAGEISPLTRFYVLWRWAFGEGRIEFDEGRKLAQSIGIDLAREWNKGFIRKENEFIEVLGPDERNPLTLEGSKELIDVLHDVLLHWKKGKTEEITRILKESGFGKSDSFYRVAQAISESLPSGSKEKKLLEGFLSGKDRISEDIKEESEQTRLFE